MRLGLSFFAGSLAVLAFAPFEFAWLAFVSLAILAACWYYATPLQGFTSGLSFGLGLYLFGTSWVYNSLAVYGGMPLWMGSIAVLGFSLLLATFIGLCGFTLTWLTRPSSGLRLILFAPAWIVFEWCKSWVLTGFPWMDIGYTQTQTILFELAPAGGVYFVSLAVAAIAASAVPLVSDRSSAILRRSLPLMTTAIVVTILCVSLQRQEWGSDIGPPLGIGIVQPNTPIEKKWGLAYRDQVIAGLVQRNAELLMEGSSFIAEGSQTSADGSSTADGSLKADGSKQLQGGSIDLIVWPETALPVLLSQTDEQFWNAVRPHQTALLTGLVDRQINAQGGVNDYNAAALHCGDELSIYRKRHLVPFGEYLPLKFMFQWVIDYLQLPMSDFSSWQSMQSLGCGETVRIGLSICYEDAFSNEHRVHAQDATLLVNISEDAWFGDSFAPHQRLQMAQMRAKELALPLVRSANSGPSVLIDHRGVVLKKTDQFVATTLRGQVQPRTGETWFRSYGEWVIYLSLLLLVSLTIVGRKAR